MQVELEGEIPHFGRRASILFWRVQLWTMPRVRAKGGEGRTKTEGTLFRGFLGLLPPLPHRNGTGGGSVEEVTRTDSVEERMEERALISHFFIDQR